MSFGVNRVDTIRALIAGSVISNSQTYQKIASEWDEVKTASSTKPKPRARLLCVIHATRALDGTLKNFVKESGIQCSGHSMGAYLHALMNHNVQNLNQLTTSQKTSFQNNIVSHRNRYMHEPGEFPASDHEVRTIISNIHTCVTVVLALR